MLWDGKPVIMAHKKALDEAVELDRHLDFFCFKQNEPSYFAKDTEDPKMSGDGAQHSRKLDSVVSDGGTGKSLSRGAKCLEATGLVAMNDIRGEFRDAYTKGDLAIPAGSTEKRRMETTKDALPLRT